jgi:CheY-like chemotaxis protein
MMPAASTKNRVRVVIVDDSAQVRTLLHLMFDEDDRFEVVGEGGDGIEAIELSERLQPDLLVLDRQMPRLGGLEAIPEVKQVSPNTVIVLFTARSDRGLHQAAFAAGALEVVDKAIGINLIDRLADALVEHWANPDTDLHVHVGPVEASAARLWIENTRAIIAAVRAHPDVLPTAPSPEILDQFEHYLSIWEELATNTTSFFWSARARPSDVDSLLEAWAAMDSMTDEQLTELGVSWSPPEAQPFYRALTSGILAALDAHAGNQELARVLRRQWDPA